MLSRLDSSSGAANCLHKLDAKTWRVLAWGVITCCPLAWDRAGASHSGEGCRVAKAVNCCNAACWQGSTAEVFGFPTVACLAAASSRCAIVRGSGDAIEHVDTTEAGLTFDSPAATLAKAVSRLLASGGMACVGVDGSALSSTTLWGATLSTPLGFAPLRGTSSFAAGDTPDDAAEGGETCDARPSWLGSVGAGGGGCCSPATGCLARTDRRLRAAFCKDSSTAAICSAAAAVG